MCAGNGQHTTCQITPNNDTPRKKTGLFYIISATISKVYNNSINKNVHKSPNQVFREKKKNYLENWKIRKQLKVIFSMSYLYELIWPPRAEPGQKANASF